MATTYEAIATVTVGSGGAADVQFTSIPATYTDLLLKCSFRYDQNSDNSIFLQFNGSTATNYSYRYIFGSGSAAGSGSGSTQSNIAAGIAVVNTYTASTFSNSEIYIPNYASSNAKSLSADNVQENNATTAYSTLVAGLWNQTAAITSIKLFPISGNIVQYSTATLYGIKNS